MELKKGKRWYNFIQKERYKSKKIYSESRGTILKYGTNWETMGIEYVTDIDAELGQ